MSPGDSGLADDCMGKIVTLGTVILELECLYDKTFVFECL